MESFGHRETLEAWYKQVNAMLCVDSDCIYKFSGFVVVVVVVFACIP